MSASIRARLVATILFREHLGEADGRAQLPPSRRLAACDFDRITKASFRVGNRRRIAHQNRFALEPM
jgi:hypothetical protein